MKIHLSILVFGLLLVVWSQHQVSAREPTTIPPVNPNDPETLPAGQVRRALVIGGGLAGLSAALELADRGYLVTIKEKEDRIGGKLFSKPVEIFRNKTFQVEHGFHAWFHNYHQFKDIRQRLSIDGNFRVWPKVHFVYKNYLPEVIYSDGPYPLNLFGIIMRSPNLKWSDMFASSLCLPDLLYYDYDKVYDKYDNITFAEWAHEKKVADSFYKIIMQPSLSVTLNEQEIFSAAEMLSFMQIYFLTNAKADGREVLTTNFHDGVIQPWLDHLTSKNVRVFTSKGVQRLKVNETTLRAYGTVDEDGDDQTVYDSVIMAADVGSVQGIFHSTLQASPPRPVANLIQTILDRHIDRMKIAPNYKVVRVWFDNQLNVSAPDILETPDFNPINLVAQYHLLEKEFADWAAQTGGSVIEFHCYTWSKYFNESEPLNNTRVWELISPTVKLIYPEIFERKFRPLAIHVNSFQNFASFERGLAKYRPYVDSLASLGLSNVFLAGDWIHTTYPSALMERAVSTGRQAANQVLLADRVRQATLLVVDKQGPGLWPNDN